MALNSDQVSIRRCKHPTHKWVASFKDGDKRVRRYFRRKQDAEDFATERQQEVSKTGSGVLSSSEKAAVLDLRDELQSYGLTIRTALEIVLEQKRLAEQSCTVSDLVRTVLQAKRLEGRSKRYLQDLDSRLGQFAQAHGERSVAEVTADDISVWLQGLDVASSTQMNFRRVLGVLFNEGLKRKYCSANPAKDSHKPKVIPSETGILTVGQLSSLLEVAPDELIPFVTIAAFAGLRRSELERLNWQQIDFESGLIEVLAKNAKSSRRRFVKIQANLEAWLLPHAKPSGAVTPSNYRELLDSAREKADIPWPHNALRHTFASAHLAAFENAAEASLQLGHTNANLVFAHYRQLIKPKDAALYWQIRPSEKSNTIAIA